ncbi:hypothetical protein J7T55_007838 [Diaporthe amygdali]|uniref:uncharacterized protein n=1 Tax=Phomopsis amygdali TaxID=1214568 RepID=UPI0022FE458F|nr:uncharacterized protein J7T55_007838 [Diaporthe amygdali]KAJ0107646.1 hypothetical protein J7T55_007838 [Diaporthe amygdali]
MGASSDHAADQEWDLVEDLGHDLCGSFETGLSLTAQKHGTHSPDSLRRASASITNSDPQKPQDYFGHYCSATVVTFEMESSLTAEQIKKAREDNRMEERARSLAWTFGGVHKNDGHKAASSKPADPAPHEYAEEDRQKLRVEYLAWMFGGVYIDNAHEDWNKLSPAEKDALREKLSGDQQCSDEQVVGGHYDPPPPHTDSRMILTMFVQMGRLLRGIRVKWCYVTTDEGTDKVRVIEDSGSANNWISNVQIKRFGLNAKRGPTITGITLTGEKFSSDKYVDVSWVGKGSHQGTERFSIAPEKAPIEMLVGEEFTRKYPGVFMDQEPTPQLLTLQSRVQVDEQQQIDFERRRMEEQANMLERRRRANPPPAPPTDAGTQSTTRSGQSTSVEKTYRQKSSQ